MSEVEFNPFDSENFEATSKLNGRRGVVLDAVFIRHNYNGKSEKDATALSVTVRVPEFEKASNNLYSAGSLWPSSEPTKLGADGKPKGGPKELTGAFLTDGAIAKGSNVADFLNELKSAGFPILEFGKLGATALVGADLTWKTIEKGKGKFAKTYDVPAEYHGRKSAEEVAALKAGASEDEAAAESAPAAAVDQSAAEAALVAATIAALKEANGEIPRGQLSIRVGSKLPKDVDKGYAMTRLLKDEFLAGIPGATWDKKILKLA